MAAAAATAQPSSWGCVRTLGAPRRRASPSAAWAAGAHQHLVARGRRSACRSPAPASRACSSATSSAPERRRLLLVPAGLAAALLLPPARQAGAATCPPGTVTDAKGVCRNAVRRTEPERTPAGDVLLPSGVRYREVDAGPDGAQPLAEGDRVACTFEVYWYRSQWNILWTRGTGGEPWRDDVGDAYVGTLGTGDFVPGLNEALVGMRVGGTRRILVPPSLGWENRDDAKPPPPDFGARRRLANHADEPLLVELTVTKLQRRA